MSNARSRLRGVALLSVAFTGFVIDSLVRRRRRSDRGDHRHGGKTRNVCAGNADCVDRVRRRAAAIARHQRHYRPAMVGAESGDQSELAVAGDVRVHPRHRIGPVGCRVRSRRVVSPRRRLRGPTVVDARRHVGHATRRGVARPARYVVRPQHDGRFDQRDHRRSDAGLRDVRRRHRGQLRRRARTPRRQRRARRRHLGAVGGRQRKQRRLSGQQDRAQRRRHRLHVGARQAALRVQREREPRVDRAELPEQRQPEPAAA